MSLSSKNKLVLLCSIICTNICVATEVKNSEHIRPAERTPESQGSEVDANSYYIYGQLVYCGGYYCGNGLSYYTCCGSNCCQYPYNNCNINDECSLYGHNDDDSVYVRCAGTYCGYGRNYYTCCGSTCCSYPYNHCDSNGQCSLSSYDDDDDDDSIPIDDDDSYVYCGGYYCGYGSSYYTCCGSTCCSYPYNHCDSNEQCSLSSYDDDDAGTGDDLYCGGSYCGSSSTCCGGSTCCSYPYNCCNWNGQCTTCNSYYGDDFEPIDDDNSYDWQCGSTYCNQIDPTTKPNGCCENNCCYDDDYCCDSNGDCVECVNIDKAVKTAIGMIAGVTIGVFVLIVVIAAVIIWKCTTLSRSNAADSGPAAIQMQSFAQSTQTQGGATGVEKVVYAQVLQIQPPCGYAPMPQVSTLQVVSVDETAVSLPVESNPSYFLLGSVPTGPAEN